MVCNRAKQETIVNKRGFLRQTCDLYCNNGNDNMTESEYEFYVEEFPLYELSHRLIE